MKCLFVCHDIVKAGYTYDGSGRLRTLTNPFSEVTTLSYDADGREITRQLANGITVSNSYDANSRLITRQHLNPGGGLLLGLTYSYNAANIRTGVAEVPGAVVTYTYDGSYQVLDNVRGPNPGAPGWAELTADEWAGLTADQWSTLEPDDGSATSFDLAATYDASGNPTAYATALGQAVTATYDASNRLSERTVTDGSGTVVTTYTYDGAGNRTEADSDDGSGMTWSWDGDGRLVEVNEAIPLPSAPIFTYDQSGLLATRSSGAVVEAMYLWDGDVLVATTDGSGAVIESYTQVPGGFGGVISTRATGDSSSSFYLFDAVGNTALVTDGSGAVTDSPVYDAFGNLVGGTEDASIFGWQGEQGYLAIGGTSAHANLYYVRQRWYDAVTRQWISADPIGMAGGDANLYRIVGNSTPSRSDPSGKSETLDTAAWRWLMRNPGEWRRYSDSITVGQLYQLCEVVNRQLSPIAPSLYEEQNIHEAQRLTAIYVDLLAEYARCKALQPVPRGGYRYTEALINVTRAYTPTQVRFLGLLRAGGSVAGAIFTSPTVLGSIYFIDQFQAGIRSVSSGEMEESGGAWALKKIDKSGKLGFMYDVIPGFLGRPGGLASMGRPNPELPPQYDANIPSELYYYGSKSRVLNKVNHDSMLYGGPGTQGRFWTTPNKHAGNFSFSTGGAVGKDMSWSMMLTDDESALFKRASGFDFSWDISAWWKGRFGQYYYRPVTTWADRAIEVSGFTFKASLLIGGAFWFADIRSKKQMQILYEWLFSLSDSDDQPK
jgi:RHS repeat-associated protein